MFEISKQFTFEAAHRLPLGVNAERNARIHGHSFRVQLRLRGERAADAAWLFDFDQLAAIMEALREELDHRYLNELPGLATPTLEVLSEWIWNRVYPSVPQLHAVSIHRDSCGESCVYYGGV
jgi:6-pyruvoyltetrahydropterin/6-carboxytetrahydropterin synthase